MSRLEKSSFSTRLLPAGQRFHAWSESISMLFDVTPPGGSPGHDFNANLNSYLINGQCMLSRCDTGAQHFERTAVHTARNGLDHYLVQTLLSGSQRVQRAGQETILRPGDLLVIDLATSHSATTSDFANLSLVVPRHLLAPHLTHPDSQGSRVIKHDQPLATLAVQHLKALSYIVGSLSADEADHTIAPTLTLLASALNGSTDTVDCGAGSVASSTLLSAKLVIERNLHRNLPIDGLCRELCLSRATLYRLFEPFGGVRAYIQERRLRRCAEALRDPQPGEQRIYDIAYRWGFRSEAHFSRAFKQRFSISPREARRLHLSTNRTANPSRSDDSPSQTGDREYERWLSETLVL